MSRSWQESNDVSSYSWLTFQEPEPQAFCKEHKDVPPPQDVLLTPPPTEPSVLHCTRGIIITTANTRFSSSSPFSQTRQPQKQCSCLCIPQLGTVQCSTSADQGREYISKEKAPEFRKSVWTACISSPPLKASLFTKFLCGRGYFKGAVRGHLGLGWFHCACYLPWTARWNVAGN